MIKVVFFGSSTGAFSNRHFDALMAAPCSIVAVVDVPAGGPASTNASAAGTSFVLRAQEARIPVHMPEKPNAPEFVAAMHALRPDLFLAAGYTPIMRGVLLEVPRLLAANFHASLLPAYRGLHPLYWALQNGERWVGLTVHVMETGIDTGDILYQVRMPVEPGDTVSTLYERVMVESLPMVPRLVADAEAGTLVRRPQSEEGASYYGHIPSDQKSRQA